MWFPPAALRCAGQWIAFVWYFQTGVAGASVSSVDGPQTVPGGGQAGSSGMMDTKRTRSVDSCGLNTFRVFCQARSPKRDASGRRRRATHEFFGHGAYLGRKGKGAGRLRSAVKSLFRGVCRITLAVADAYRIVGPIPHAIPNFHDFMREDPEREGASLCAHEDRARK